MIFRHITGLLRNHGCISKGALERSLASQKLREINARVSKWLLMMSRFTFTRFTIPFRFRHIVLQESLSPLIQVSLPKRSNVVFTSVICNPLNLLSRYAINRVLLWFEEWSMIAGGYPRPTHPTQRPFYITLNRQKNHALRENYASELHQVMIIHLSRAGLTS